MKIFEHQSSIDLVCALGGSRHSDNRTAKCIISKTHYSRCGYDWLVIEIYPISTTDLINDQPFSNNIISSKDYTYKFDLLLDHDNKKAKFATLEDVLLPPELQGFGIASYAFSTLIRWGQNHGNLYAVESLYLGPADGQIDEKRDIRNRFYESFNFKLKFKKDTEKRVGRCCASSLSVLVAKDMSSRVTITSVESTIHSQWTSLENQKRINKNLSNSLKDIDDRRRNLLIKYRKYVGTLSISLIICVVIITFLSLR